MAGLPKLTAGASDAAIKSFLSNSISFVVRNGKRVGIAGGVVVGAVVADEFILNDAGKNWLKEQGIDIPSIGGYLTELAGDAARKVNKELAEAAAGAVSGVYETLYAHAQGLGILLYNLGFTTVGKSIANWGRKSMNGFETDPLVESGGKLVALSEVGDLPPAAPVRAVGDPAPVTPAATLTANFNAEAFKTEFAGTVLETDLGKSISQNYRRGGTGDFPSDSERIMAVNRTIGQLEIGPLIDILENSTSDARIRSGLAAIESDTELSREFNEMRKVQGIQGITAMFSKLAANEQAAPVAVRAALNMSPN